MPLSHPSRFVTAVVNAISDDLTFYCQDNAGRFTYLSKSAEQVLGIPANRLLNQSISSALTDHPWNETIRSGECLEDQGPVAKPRVCEIYDGRGNRLQLKYWSAPLFKNGVFVGRSGMVRRLDDDAAQEFKQAEPVQNAERKRELMLRVGRLTKAEFDVVEFVVDGRMNKEISVLLGVAVRTVESRRSKAMTKLGVKSLAELVQCWVHVREIRAKASN